MNPKVSVVVPVFNAEKFLPECLDSLLGQTLPVFEIIVCDDCSSDGSRSVIESYAKAHPNQIRPLFQTNNVGISKNLNSGFQMAKGTLFSLCAGDDFWRAGKIEREIKALEANPAADWCYSLSVIYAQNKDKWISFQREFEGAEGNVLFQVLSRQMALRNWIAKRELIENVGYYDESLKCYEDWDYKIRLAKKGRIAHVPEENVVYRKHGAGISEAPLKNLVWLEAVQAKHLPIVEQLPDEQRALIQETWQQDLVRHASWFRAGKRFVRKLLKLFLGKK